MTQARPIYTDLNLLISDQEWGKIVPELPPALAAAGYAPSEIHAEVLDLTCEPDNMLLNQYESIEGRSPLMPVQRIVINGHSSLDLRTATEVVVAQLPADTYWFGTSGEGELNPGLAAACAWQHP
ncbi:MAG TPA: hypothetical protein VFC72_03630 [Corynebacterium sp.]|nr:hypothetical protein [Corynebacterium sp.]